VVGKLLTVAVIALATWQASNGLGIPGWNELRHGFAHWDSQSYLQIAATGYPANSDSTPGAAAHVWAFMPGFPLLLKAVNYVVDDYILSGVLVSTVGELIALVFVARLVSAERDERAARFSVWLLALLPYGVFLSVVYTESAFLAAAAASLYYMRQERFATAAICGALATCVRITGMALFFAFIVEYALVHRIRPRADALTALLIPLPFVLFCVYAGVHAHDPRAFFHIQASESYHRELSYPWDGLRATWAQFTADNATRQTTYNFMLELVAGMLGLLACVLLWTWRWVGARWNRAGIPWSFALYATVVWVLAVAQPYWLSVGRYEIVLLPVLIILADVCSARPRRAVAVLTVSAGLLACFATLWAQDMFVG
jgi:Gpi18-like mannosyltransferase